MHIARRGSGPDLVLVHGWAMHAGIFAQLADALAPHHTLHLVDLPGHGRSTERAGPFELRTTAKRIAAAVPPAAWLGWSLGGLVCLEAAFAAPSRVRALALIATSPRFVLGPHWPHGVEPVVFAQFRRNLETDYHGALARFLALECHGSDCARAELRALRAQVFVHGEPASQVLQDGLRILAETDFRARLASLAVPSLWIAGGRDRLVPWRAMEWAAQAAPAGRYTCIAGGGHALFIGHPDTVLRAVRAFLEAAVPAC